MILPERFWSKVDKSHGCWLWGSCLSSLGYGLFWFQGKSRRAHRLSYVSLVGSIPRGKVIDHLCRISSCVNPSHMEPVTQRENVLRGFGPTAMNSRKTECKNGHLLSGDNLKPKKNRQRECFICHRAQNRRWRLKNKLEQKISVA